MINNANKNFISVLMIITILFASGCVLKESEPALELKSTPIQSPQSPIQVPIPEQPVQTPTAQVYFGLFTYRSMDEIYELVGKKPSILQLGISFEEEYNQFPLEDMEKIRRNGAIPDILWTPLNFNPDPTLGATFAYQPKFQLKKIIRGDFDQYIRQFAKDAKKFGHPFFLRFAHEMNGDWYPWSETVNDNSKGEYVQMWKHVHDIFEDECPKCATWIWAPDAGGQSYTPPVDFTELYPGDDYVDWIGLSVYNVEVARSDAPWEEFENLVEPAYKKLQKIAPDKPIYIAETGSTEIGGNKTQWIRNALTSLKKFPKINAYSYFDMDASEQGGFPDTRINTSPESISVFREIISDPYFASNEFESLNVSPIPAINLLSVPATDTQLVLTGSVKPFPHHTPYTPGTIKPNTLSQQELDNVTAVFYQQWKQRYLVQGCGSGRYYVFINRDLKGTEGGKDINSISTTEGHGYGMIITVLMAGYEPEAKKIFDGMYWFYKDHPSSHHPYLGAWNQVVGCKNAYSEENDGSATATDGDMDMAYALLLADKQWGSDGKIPYLEEAKKMINAILEKEINPETSYILLGTEKADSDPKYYYGTRPSDFMTNHLKVFYETTKNPKWKEVLDNTYSLIDFMQKTYSPQTGLLPDFIYQTNTIPTPVPPNYFENPGYDDDYYYYNACRVPWRIATDYLMTGDSRAKKVVEKINTWIMKKVNGIPENLNGYSLVGEVIGTPEDQGHLCFAAPLGVSAMIDKEYQEWLNSLWEYVVNTKIQDSDYYGNTLKMLTMIVISGNWWAT